jgi:hypothetical protein
MSTLNTYCGILSTCHNYNFFIIVDWILCQGEIKDYAIKTKILESVDWIVTCNKIVIAVTN